jgi:hypothetical protein
MGERTAAAAARVRKRVGCHVPCCWRPHFARGLCQMHYRRWWRRRDTGPHFPQCAYVGPRAGPCPVLVRTPGSDCCHNHRRGR